MSDTKLSFNKLNTLNTIVAKHTKYIDDLTTGLESRFGSIDKTAEKHDTDIKALLVTIDMIKNDYNELKTMVEDVRASMAKIIEELN